MSGAEEVKFSLKVVVNKQKNKVLFAEANSDFVDVLISFLTLPLGAVVRVLKKHYGDKEAPTFGSLTSLYNGLSNLDSRHFWTEGLKEILLNPRSSFYAEFLKLKLDISDTQPTEYFTCENQYQYCPGKNLQLSCLSMYYDTAKCFCRNEMTRKLGTKMCRAGNGDCEVFTRNTAPFIISDDLQIFPNSTNFIRILGNLGITDMDFGYPRIVTFGFSEMMDLLKGSLLSRTPLTDVLLNNKREVGDFAGLKFELEKLAPKKEEATYSNSKKMILKVMVQKSTNKILFARAEEDFVDFLCVLLAVPLGAVECLLDNQTCLKAIANLYGSIADNMDKHLVTPEMKNRLMKGNLPHGYISKNQTIPLTEESFNHTYTIGSRRKKNVQFSSVKFVKGGGKYIRGPTMYKVTDDLTVTPSCMASTVSDLKEQNIPLSDIQELELEIGSEEALSILKASLTSTSALSGGLKINTTMLMKQPKQEQ